MRNPSKSISRRAMSAALVATAGVTTTGCFGSFGLSKMVYDWNDSFGSKWVKWLVFLGLNIVPIYGITIFVDSLVLNSIEFWFGTHPVASNTNAQGSRVAGKSLPEGQRVVSTSTEDPNVIRHELYQDDRRVGVVFLRREGEEAVSLLDERGRVLTRVELDSSHLTLSDAQGDAIVRLDQADCRMIAEKTRQGEVVTTAIFDQIANTGQATKLGEASAKLQTQVRL